MAEKVTRRLVDDMEDEEVDADAGTVPFGLDGRDYEIDLSAKNASVLRTALQPFIENARLISGSSRPRQPSRRAGAPSGYNRDQLMQIRHWARRNGYPDLSDKGRVPAEVLERFEEAHAGGANGQPAFSSYGA